MARLVHAARELAAKGVVTGELAKLQTAQAVGDLPQVANSLAALSVAASDPSEHYGGKVRAALGMDPIPGGKVSVPDVVKAVEVISTAAGVVVPTFQAVTAAAALSPLAPFLAPVSMLSTIASAVHKEVVSRKAHKQAKHDFLRLRDSILEKLRAGATAPLRSGGATAPPPFPRRLPCHSQDCLAA